MADKKFNSDKDTLEKKILQEWPDLSEKDLGEVLGNRDRLVQKLVQDYGLSYEEAERRLNEIDK